MPSRDLLDAFQRDLAVEAAWRCRRPHYARTCEAWLANLDRGGADLAGVLARTYGAPDARRWRHRWALFLLGCAELFAHDGGEAWLVGHYRLRPA